MRLSMAGILQTFLLIATEGKEMEYQGVSQLDFCCEAYKALFDGLAITTKQNEHITQATLRGEAYGSDAFHQRIEKIISRPTRLVAHGGDRKSDIYRNQAG